MEVEDVEKGLKLPAMGVVLGAVRDKCPGFCKCLICSNMDLTHFRILLSTKSDQHPSKRPTEHDVYGNKNKVYLNITANFYPLVHIIRRLYGS